MVSLYISAYFGALGRQSSTWASNRIRFSSLIHCLRKIARLLRLSMSSFGRPVGFIRSNRFCPVHRGTHFVLCWRSDYPKAAT